MRRAAATPGRQTVGVGDGDALDRRGAAAYLRGADAEAERSWEQAHQIHLRAGDADRAVRSAFWLGLTLALRGEGAPAAGWLARARTVHDPATSTGMGRGYLLVAEAIEVLGGGDPHRAASLSAEAASCGRRCGDADLWALGSLGRGEALVAAGAVADGTAVLDELMATVLAGELSPVVCGIAYCAVVEACVHGHDLQRAAQWTDALTRWCDEQPDAVPFRGQCRVHRAQVFHACGRWDRALEEARWADRLLAQPPHPARGSALCVLGDLHRLRGRFDDAERAYRDAIRCGFEPVPGLPLLRLAQGRGDAAVGGISRALAEAADVAALPSLLAAAVEIFVAAGDLTAAAGAAERLAELASDGAPDALQAMAAHASGLVLLVHGDAQGALLPLRRACRTWQALDVPYEAARARVVLAEACRAVGDGDGADDELDSARSVFQRLGAAPDLSRLPGVAATGAGELSERERDVLRLVAQGSTNKDIGRALGISEHTAARHLQNIFNKLDVSSRAAAVATALDRRVI